MHNGAGGPCCESTTATMLESCLLNAYLASEGRFLATTKVFNKFVISGLFFIWLEMLFCLILVRTLTGASVHYDVRWDGVERHDRQMTSAHGTSDEQGRDMEPSLLTSTRSMRLA